MKIFIQYLLSICLIFTGALYGQLQITELTNVNLTTEVQNIFAGGGVIISNAVYTGGTDQHTQLGRFTNPAGSGHVIEMFDEGLV